MPREISRHLVLIIRSRPPPGGTWNSWLNGGKTVLDIASNVPGPIGTASSVISAGINLAQGNYAEVGTSLAIAAAAGIGLGLAAKAAVKAIEAARAARAAKMAESLAVDAAKAAETRLTSTVGDLRAAGLKDAHHVVQDAAVRDPWLQYATCAGSPTSWAVNSDWNSALHRNASPAPSGRRHSCCRNANRI